ncbi:PspC domain-containing protein [Flindersiella endophytica]
MTTNLTDSKPQADYYGNSDFHAEFGSDSGAGSGAAFHGQPRPAVRKLTRPRQGRMLAGVCAGVANYLKVDPAIVRFAAVVLAIFTAGTAALVYAAGWVLMPEETTDTVSAG